MISVQEDFSLQGLNSLAIDATARFFTQLTDIDQIPLCIQFAKEKNLTLFVLGGGSNIVLAQNFSGLVIKNCLSGIELLQTDNTITSLRVAAGENWKELVDWTLQHGFYGLENLSLIPGCVGAAPIQNIGAYGVELVDVLESVEGWDILRGQHRTLTKSECEFGYRDSIFKHALKNSFIITHITLKLRQEPVVNISYQALQDYFRQQEEAAPTPLQVADAVCNIRRSKLPDPHEIPNAGSFFKNPIVNQVQLDKLLSEHPDMVYYPQASQQAKLAAGWLLEKAGWKGIAKGPVGMHNEQSLVLVNPGLGTGQEVLKLAADIQQDIMNKFSVTLEIEPVIISC